MKNLAQTNYLVIYQIRERYAGLSQDFISIFFDNEPKVIDFLNELYSSMEDWEYFVFRIFSIENGKIIQNNELTNNISSQFTQHKLDIITQEKEKQRLLNIELELNRKKEIQDKKELYLSWLKKPDESLKSKYVSILKLKIDNLLSFTELSDDRFNTMIKPYHYRGLVLRLKNKNKDFEWWYTTMVNNYNFEKIDSLINRK